MQDSPAPSQQRQISTGVALAFLRGDSEAVRAVRIYVRKILSFGRFGIPGPDREDVEQEIMADLWRSARRAGFDPGGGFWGFVEIITARRCIDWRREVRMDVEFDESFEDRSESPFRIALHNERKRLVREALSNLPPACRNLLRLRVTEGLGFKEIAEIEGRRAGTIRVQFHRCLRKLEKSLRETED